MLQIGAFKLEPPWLLAPMAGVSELPFRRIARELGAAAAPTELVSAKGLAHKQGKSECYLRHDPDERPFWVQLFGGEPEAMAIAAERAVALGANLLDVNMGCPVKKVTKTGAGAALLRDPERAAAVVGAMVKRVKTPVTVKIRSGWDTSNVAPWELVARLADVGAAAVAIHARTCKQGYSGEADWRVIAELVARSPIPVIGNGDASSPERARAMLAQTGCAAVMIGRGALGNPWIFKELTEESPPPDAPGRWPLIARHLQEHVAYIGEERRAVRAFRPHLAWYSRGLPESAAFRHRVIGIDKLSDLLTACADFFASGRGPTKQLTISSRSVPPF